VQVLPFDILTVFLSVGCHCPLVSPVTWPFVFFMSLMYMSPRMNSPRANPFRSYSFACNTAWSHSHSSEIDNRVKYLCFVLCHGIEPKGLHLATCTNLPIPHQLQMLHTCFCSSQTTEFIICLNKHCTHSSSLCQFIQFVQHFCARLKIKHQLCGYHVKASDTCGEMWW